jgi:trimethylamine:corrinoid methyltransferase-like protein
MFATNLLKDEHIEPLAEGVLTVLERVGVLSENDELCRALADWGAEVDFDTQRARFPRARVAEFVEGLRKEFSAQSDPWGHTFPSPGLAGIGTQVAQLYHDIDTDEMRSSNATGFIELTKLGAVLHPEGAVGHVLSMTDVPPLLEPLKAGLLLAEWAPVPGGPFVWRVDQADWMIELGHILGQEQWFTWGAVCFAHPLRFDRDTVGKFVRRVKEGSAAGLTGMPVAGVSTPVTLEGFAVVSIAEHIATWIAGRALNPTVPLSGSMWGGSVDMRSGTVSYSAPDAMLYSFAGVEFLRRWLGFHMAVGAGEYCDAKKPGLYTALEKAHKSMTVSAFTGQPPGAGSGLIDEGKTMSGVQLLLDREYSVATECLSRTLDPTPERMALDVACEVGIGLETNYLQTDHTARHFRETLWLPQIVDRSGWNGVEGEAEALARTKAKLRELLASYQKPEGREDQLAAMQAVYARAEKALLGT